jgi:hypothetical protein
VSYQRRSSSSRARTRAGASLVPASRQRSSPTAASPLVTGSRKATARCAICQITSPPLGCALADAQPGWIFGIGLADGASVLIHDGQYADEEYEDHAGWGHSRIEDAIAFADRADVRRLVLFHHDPTHDDLRLDALAQRAHDAWIATGRDGDQVALAAAGTTIAL